MTNDVYQLIDFGQGRKLERFGDAVLDRPAPAAVGSKPRTPAAWAEATARFERHEEQGQWEPAGQMQAPWLFRRKELTLELKLTEFGHLGLFPEQFSQWDWLGDEVRRAGRPLDVLNLFAYTGGSTLAAAAAGARVTHVDAAANVVRWARRNALLSGLDERPIRWITDDALKFARREARRGQRYQGIVIDPPGYGHGPSGEAWKLEKHLPALVALCNELLGDDRLFFLITCHTGDLGTPDGLLKFLLAEAPWVRETGSVEAVDLSLVAATGKRLACGAAVHWTARSAARSARRSSTHRAPTTKRSQARKP